MIVIVNRDIICSNRKAGNTPVSQVFAENIEFRFEAINHMADEDTVASDEDVITIMGSLPWSI